MSARSWLAPAVIAFGGLFLSACVVAPVEPYYVGEPILVAPPPPRVEIVGVAPGPGHVWITGYWTWSGGRHHWMPGRWAAPRPGYHWQPHQWERHGPRWRERRGHWARR